MNAIACRREKNINRCGNFIEIRSDVNIYMLKKVFQLIFHYKKVFPGSQKPRKM